MSDKYYLHDCNSYTHSCQTKYRTECRDSKIIIEPQKSQEKLIQNPSWWQRLLGAKSQARNS